MRSWLLGSWFLVAPAQPDGMSVNVLFFALVLLFLAGCGRPAGSSAPEMTASPEPARWFEDDDTNRSGLTFVHQAEVSGRYLFSESMGSGAAFLDYDQDGRLDVFLIHNVHPSALATNRLYHQEADGRFKDVSVGSGLEAAGYGNGLAVGDLNNDGRPEILITEYDRVRLFLNEAPGRFRDVTASAGLTNRHWSIPAAFFDYDRDGWLDLVIGNYLDFDPNQKCPDARGQPDYCGPHGFASTITRLFRNVTARSSGDLKFDDVTVTSGLARAPGKAMQIVCADFDGDRWPDIFVTDDGLPNRLFMNQRNGGFREEGVARGVAYTGTGGTPANMGIALGDVDGDGLFDLFVPHLSEENHTLWRQGARGVFEDGTAQARLLTMPWHGTGFGAVFADFDRDGALDLAVANGAIRRRPNAAPAMLAASLRQAEALRADRRHPGLAVSTGLSGFWAPYAEPSQLFANDGSGRFREVSQENAACCGEPLVGRGLLCGDVDNNGRLDLLLTGIGAPVRLCRNVAARPGHWLLIRAVDPALGGRDAYGAEIRVRARGREWWRLIQPASSYASSQDPRAHFGLGTATTFERINVLWPDGFEETFPGGPVDRFLTLPRGTGAPP